MRIRAAKAYNFVHLALKLTTLPCEVRKSYSSSLQQYDDVRYGIVSTRFMQLVIKHAATNTTKCTLDIPPHLF